jgi:hypothetical protein
VLGAWNFPRKGVEGIATWFLFFFHPGIFYQNLLDKISFRDYIDSWRFLMQVEIKEEVKEVFQGFGITNIGTILENEAIMMLLTKESKYRAEYNLFKNKYNSEFEDFKKKVESSGKEDFDVEDDLMDWEFAANALKTIEEQKRALGV